MNNASLCAVMEQLKTQGSSYSIEFLSNPDMIFEVHGDTAVGEKKSRRKIIIDDDEEEEEAEQITSSFRAFDDDAGDEKEVEQITSIFRVPPRRRRKKRTRKKTPEENLRSQCSLRIVDVNVLLVDDVDVILALSRFKDIAKDHAKREGVKVALNNKYQNIGNYLKDHMAEVVEESYHTRPDLFHRCVTTCTPTRPHSLRRI